MVDGLSSGDFMIIRKKKFKKKGRRGIPHK
jgi:hypothetical protein